MQNDCILWICNGRYTSGMAAIYVCVVSVKVSQNISMTVIKSLLMMTNTRRFWEQFVRLTGVCFTFRLTLFFKSRGWEVLFLQIFKPWNHSCQNMKAIFQRLSNSNKMFDIWVSNSLKMKTSWIVNKRKLDFTDFCQIQSLENSMFTSLVLPPPPPPPPPNNIS